MLHHPLSLKGVYLFIILKGVHSFIIYVNFYRKMKKNSTCVYIHRHTKIAQKASACLCLFTTMIQEELVDKLRINTVVLSNDQDVMSFSTLVASTSHNVGHMHVHTLDIEDDVGAEGWAELARILPNLVEGGTLRSLWPVGTFNVIASKQAMVKGTREDLRTICEAALGEEEEDRDLVGTLWCVRSQYGRFGACLDWEEVVREMERAEEEPDEEIQ